MSGAVAAARERLGDFSTDPLLCIRFALEASEGLTGRPGRDDYAELGQSASAELERAGSLLVAIEARLGRGLPPATAELGDLVLAELAIVSSGHITAQALGVCVGRKAAFIRRARGIHYRPLGRCLARWPACLVQR